MGEKEGKGEEKEKKVSDGGEKKVSDGGEKKKGGGGGGGGEKKEEGPPKVVLNVDMHCEGCASKIKRSVKGFEGVEGVTTDMLSNKLTVIGKVDPWKLRDRVEAKTKKKVEIISPVNPPKKDTDGGKKPTGGGDSKDQKKPDDKKSKEPAATTAMLKIRLHCDGCIQRIKKTILKIKGVQEVNVDAQKDLVTVKGIMDVKSLPQYLKDKLNRSVEIVPGKNDGGGGGGGGGEKKENAGGGGGGGGGGGEKKEKVGGGGDGEKKGKEGGGGGGDGGGKKGAVPGQPAAASLAGPVAMEANKMEYYGPYGYRVETLHAPQLFSDENPNACSVM